MPPPPPTGLGEQVPPPATAGGPSPYQGPTPYLSAAPYPQPDLSTPGARSGNTEGIAVASLIVGLLALPLLLLCWFLSIPAAIAAIILGIIAITQANRSVPPRPKGMAIAGVALGGSVLLLSVLFIAVLIPTLSMGTS